MLLLFDVRLSDCILINTKGEGIGHIMRKEEKKNMLIDIRDKHLELTLQLSHC
jgi:hypothetical protein